MTESAGPTRTLVNGQWGVRVSSRDRGLQYGDGLFETVLGRDGSLLLWARHLSRLLAGCARLGIPPPSEQTLTEEAASLLAAHGNGIIKIMVTRGDGGRGYRPPQPANPTRILSWHQLPAAAAERPGSGVRVRLCRTRLGHSPDLAGLKHLNRLEQVLARGEWSDPNIGEGLMLDLDDHPVEGTMSNLFLVGEGRLHTPDLSLCGVAGVVRAWVMDHAQALGSSCLVGRLSLEDVLTAEEVFLCNSVIGIWPVGELDGHPLPVGPVTRQLQRALEQEVGGGWTGGRRE